MGNFIDFEKKGMKSAIGWGENRPIAPARHGACVGVGKSSLDPRLRGGGEDRLDPRLGGRRGESVRQGRRVNKRRIDNSGSKACKTICFQQTQSDYNLNSY